MKNCLEQLNTNTWEKGLLCVPKNPDGTITSGVTFGMVKAGFAWDDPMDCYTKCAGCLAKGIENSVFTDRLCAYDAGGDSKCVAALYYTAIKDTEFREV